ncbi:MAG: hypothetical protein JO131_03760, partial [Gammaproteobacteria bacterium]|nr:hypothetical protein [Gammaproteobacteria bacterium]
LAGFVKFVNYMDEENILKKNGCVVTLILQDLVNPTARKLNLELVGNLEQEDERLIPPGAQLSYFWHIEKQNNLHFFFAKVVNTKQTEAYTEKAEKKLNDAYQNVEYHILSLLKKQDIIEPLDMKPIKNLMANNFLLFKTSNDGRYNNLLHHMANYLVSINDCASIFTKNCFLNSLFEKNFDYITPLEKFFWRNEDKSHQIMNWLCKDFYLKLKPQQKQCFNNKLRAELSDAKYRRKKYFTEFLELLSIQNVSSYSSNHLFQENSRKRHLNQDTIEQLPAKKLQMH